MRTLVLVLGALVLCSCARFQEKDLALERYKQYCEELNAAVEAGELTPMQASTLEIQAYNQYLMIRQQRQQMQSIEEAQFLGLLAGMNTPASGSSDEGQIINQPQKVFCTNC